MKVPRKKGRGGRFAKASDRLLEAFNASLSFDHRLYNEDIDGSIAHTRALKKGRVLTSTEAKKIERGLNRIRAEIAAGKLRWSDSLEDIHMAIESRLTQQIGPAGAKLHTGRSRNDQVATDLRLYCKKVFVKMEKEITRMEAVLAGFADRKAFLPAAGYTHLQPAQPILWAHHWMAYFEMLERDKGRIHDALVRADFSPLGSGAVAGTTFPIDREYEARQLGFAGVTRNSIDAVSDRDFVAELLFAATLLMTHLSRLCEEIILWSSREFGFLSLPDEFCTGSSMMPQKKNPDVPELIRGKAGRVQGDLVTLLTVLKGLPLAYNKDLQEDKEPLFDAVDTVSQSLVILTALIPGISVNASKLAASLNDGFLLATDLADYLAQKGIPFRLAHEIVGKIVAFCLKTDLSLEHLSLPQLKKFSAAFGADVRSWLTVRGALERRAVIGGTAPQRVRSEIARARKKIAKDLTKKN